MKKKYDPSVPWIQTVLDDLLEAAGLADEVVEDKQEDPDQIDFNSLCSEVTKTVTAEFNKTLESSRKAAAEAAENLVALRETAGKSGNFDVEIKENNWRWQRR